MGIIQKQGLRNAIILSVGIVIGFANVLLSPRILTAEQYGLLSILNTVAILFVQFASLGLPNVVAKYLAQYKQQNYAGFLAWVTQMAAICFALFLLVYFLFQKPVATFYNQKSPLFVSYYLHLIPLVLFTFVFNLLEILARGFYQSVFATVLREPFLKTTNLLGLMLFAFGWISFDTLIWIYIASNGMMCLLLLLQLYTCKAIVFQQVKKIDYGASRQMLSYGMHLFLASIAWVVLNKIDLLFIGQKVGLAAGGIYAYYTLWASLIRLPTNAINRISYQLVADAWVVQDVKKINEVYEKTSMVQMTIGLLIFIGIALNKHNIIAIIGDKNGYAAYFDLFYIIGASVLIDVTGGLNAQIVMLSHRYKIASVFSFMALFICVVANYVLIRYVGLSGAAWALLITLFGYNFFNWYYIKRQFNMQPFGNKYFVLLLIACFVFIIVFYTPLMFNYFIDLVLRSLLIILIYGSAVIYFNISDDITLYGKKCWAKAKQYRL